MPNQNDKSRKDRKKEKMERLNREFGLNDNPFGLNGQDFGIAELKHSMQVNASPMLQRPSDELVVNQETLEAFYDDVGSLWCGFGAIPVLDEPPSALTFLRDYVSVSRPCIIRNALLVRDARGNCSIRENLPGKGSSHLSLLLAANDPSVHPDKDNVRPLHLSLDDIVEMDPSLEIAVDATPDGHGDCVRTVVDHGTGQHQRFFVTPEERHMTLAEFRTQLRDGRRNQRVKGTKLEGDRSSKSKSSNDPSRKKSSNEINGTEDDLEFDEELYDKSDGKRIFAIKGSQKRNKTKKDEGIFNSCTPEATPTAGCIADMGELLMDIIDDNRLKQKTEPGLDIRESPPPPPPSVLYYSRQNDCFRNELPSIYEATRHVIPPSFEFAEEAFGTGKPEAVNLWMGDERAISSMHKDPYENLFYVASGEKIFTLCPPADAPYLYEKDFLSASFDSQLPRPNQTVFPKKRHWTVKTGFESSNDVETDSDSDDDIRLNQNDLAPVRPGNGSDIHSRDLKGPSLVRWIEADVSALTDPYYERYQLLNFPLLKYAHPIHQVRVQAGELLYLPALWFHRVTQSRETVGINYWYNMNFNSPQWCYFQLLAQLQLKPPPTYQGGQQQQKLEQYSGKILATER